MNRYESYKDTPYLWIGKIPNHWQIQRVKFVCNDIFPGATPSTAKKEYWDGNIPWIPSGCCHDCDVVEAPKYITDLGLQNSSTRLIPANTTIIALTGATCSQLGYLKIEACANQSVIAFVENEKKANSRFLFYALRSARSNILTNQTGGAQAGINMEDCKNIILVFPPLEEQKAIADFLDAKTAELDEEKENLLKQIELLKELKLSTISNTVVSGLNKDVTFVDSKVNEIGFIPKHWSCVRIKRKVRVIRGGSPRPIEAYLTKGNGYNWIKIGDAIKGSKYITHTEQKIKEDGLKSTRLVSKGDLILSNSMSFGQPYILNIDGCIHDGWVAFSHFNGVNKEYLFYTLLSKSLKSQFEKTVDGSVVSNLNIDKIGMSFIPLPPLNEQEEIASYLDVKATEIDEQIQLQEQQIKLIDELKQSIISQAVTGKIKVF